MHKPLDPVVYVSKRSTTDSHLGDRLWAEIAPCSYKITSSKRAARPNRCWQTSHKSVRPDTIKKSRNLL